MCSTRSPYQEAPATDPGATGVLLVGHGSTRRPEALVALANHAQAIAGRGLFADVRHAALNGGPEPGEELARMRGLKTVLVFPMFMSAGYLVRDLLPRKLGRTARSMDVRLCPPLGLCPEFIDLVARRAQKSCDAEGWSPHDVDLVLAAHGSSNDPTSRLAAEDIATALVLRTHFASLQTAYLEEAPFLAQVIRALDRRTMVLGLFASDGVHAAHDVPAALAEAPNPVVYTGPLGCDARIADVVVAAITRETTVRIAAA